MSEYKIRIQQYHLLEVPVKPAQILKFMSDAFALVSDNENAFENSNKSIEIFHNRKNTYPVIQFNADKGYPIITAYGDNAIKALDIWFELYRKQNPAKIQNYKQTIEYYFFKPEAEIHTYRIKNFLINHERYDSIKQADKLNFNSGLSEYIVNVLQYFLSELQYKANANPLRLKAEIIKAKQKAFVKPFKYASKFACFDISFKLNIRLPDIIALGIATSRGYGVVNKINK